MTDSIGSIPDAAIPPRRQFMKMAEGATAGLAFAGVTTAQVCAGGNGMHAPAALPTGLALPRATSAIMSFRVEVPESDIADLKARLSCVRFPEKETVSDLSQGVPLEKARVLVEHWRDHYDWKAFERKINAVSQFRTEIGGLGIHFLHIRSKHENALPMIMTHGWPGSFVEFLKVIDPLTNPTAHGGTSDEAFHLVIPSQPGYGFSDKPFETGWNLPRIAKAWAVLMQRFGYD